MARRTVVPKFQVDPAQLGPAMRALSPARRAFVFAKCRRVSNTEAARLAGYSDRSRHSLQVAGHKLILDRSICAAIKELDPALYCVMATRREIKRLIKITLRPGPNQAKAAIKVLHLFGLGGRR
jgi:phage terminase small subunit